MTLMSRSSIASTFVAGAVFCTLLTGVSPAAAQTAGSPTQGKLHQLITVSDQWVPTSSGRTAELLRVWDAGQGGSASGLTPDRSAAEGFQTPDGLVLRLPFAAHSGVLAESGIAAVFDGHGQTAGTSELVLTARSADSGRVQTWTDGILRVDRVVREADASVQARSTWWSRFSDCLNSKGVAAWAVTALTVACSAICIASVGTLCLGCLAAASAVTSGTISYCVAKASRG